MEVMVQDVEEEEPVIYTSAEASSTRPKPVLAPYTKFACEK